MVDTSRPSSLHSDLLADTLSELRAHWSWFMVLAGFFFWTASGLLYTGAGVLAIVNPVAGASVLTLLFGATLISTCCFRAGLCFSWGWH